MVQDVGPGKPEATAFALPSSTPISAALKPLALV